MTRQDFYIKLALELNNRKVPPELINTHIDQFKSYLESLSEEEAEKQIESFGPLGELADNIYKLLCGDEPVETAASDDTVYDPYIVESENEKEDVTVVSDVEVSEESAQIDDFLVELFDDDEKKPSGDEHKSNVNKKETEKKAESINFDVSNPDDYLAPDLNAFSNDNIPAAPAELDDAGKVLEEIDIDKIYEENKNKIGKGSVRFWVIAILTLPITLPLFVSIMALFGFLYLIITLLVSATFISIFASAISGSALTLASCVYGVLQVRTGVFPIGIYEIGLGLCVAGITLLVSMFFYVLSLKLLPKLYRYLTKLLSLFLNGLLSLIAKIQKECAAK